MSLRHYLFHPLVDDNPITVQILGLCSALAVSRSLVPALIMGISVIAVLVFASVAVSLMRNAMPRNIRLILEVTIIASGVVVVDEVLKTYAPGVSQVLSVFVGLIITNCIILGRTEAFAMHHGPLASAADALGNGAAYAAILVFVGAVRELLGAGALLERQVLPLVSEGGWYRPNEMMLYAPSAFFIIALVVWGLRTWRPPRGSTAAAKPRHLSYQELAS